MPRMLSTPPSMREMIISLLALLLLSAVPANAYAQVFIASHPQPEFNIGPLFLSASVGKQNLENVDRGPSSLTVSVSWSLSLPPHRRSADIAQDLYLLWPGEVVGTPGSLKRHLCTALFALIALGLLVSGHYAIGSAVTVATALYGWL